MNENMKKTALNFGLIISAVGILFSLTAYVIDEKLFVNIGTGSDLSIKDLAEMIQDVVGYEGNIVWNTNKLIPIYPR